MSLVLLSLSFGMQVEIPQLVALYARADVCLATALVEGQNLIAKEFVASEFSWAEMDTEYDLGI